MSDKVDEITDLLRRYTEDLRRELANRDLRIENMQREFGVMTQRAVNAERAASDAESWLAKIRRALHDAGLVRGDYEASVKALIADAKMVPELSRRLADANAKPRVLVERSLYDASQETIEELRGERNEAMTLLREHAEAYSKYADVTQRIKTFLAEAD